MPFYYHCNPAYCYMYEWYSIYKAVGKQNTKILINRTIIYLLLLTGSCCQENNGILKIIMTFSTKMSNV